MALLNPCLNILPTSQVIGLSFTALAGFISSFAVLFVLILVARNYIRNVLHPPPGGEWRLIRTHVDAYLLSLLLSDFLQGLGAILNIKWSAERQVYCSATCTAQGSVQIVGETGVALSTLAITIQTFLVIFFRWSPSPRSSWIWKAVITAIWLYVCIFAAVGYGKHHSPSSDPQTADIFFTPTPYWCWISGKFDAERIAGEYFWLWFAAFVNIILYTLLFFRVRGNITVDPLNWRRVRFKWHRYGGQGRTAGGEGYFDSVARGARGGEAGKDAAKEALSMIWYPVTYTILVLPLSIVRWSTFRPPGRTEPHVPFAVTSVVIVIFSLSGAANVVLILWTRKNLLLFGQRGVVNPAKIGPAATGRAQRLQALEAKKNARRKPEGDPEDNVGVKRIQPSTGAEEEEVVEGPGGMGNEKSPNGHRRGSSSSGNERKGRFGIRHFIGLAPLQIGSSKEGGRRNSTSKAGPDQGSSTNDTSTDGIGPLSPISARGGNRSARNGGDTSFAAGGFTTGAFESERSFELGSTGVLPPPLGTASGPSSPSTPISVPAAAGYSHPLVVGGGRMSTVAEMSQTGTGGVRSHADVAGAEAGEESSAGDIVYAFGSREPTDAYGYGDELEQQHAIRTGASFSGLLPADSTPPTTMSMQLDDGVVPEGMSRDLGALAAEYDIDIEREKERKGLQRQLGAYSFGGSPSQHDKVARLEVPGHGHGDAPGAQISNRSDFLDLERSTPGHSSAGVSTGEHGKGKDVEFPVYPVPPPLPPTYPPAPRRESAASSNEGRRGSGAGHEGRRGSAASAGSRAYAPYQHYPLPTNRPDSSRSAQRPDSSRSRQSESGKRPDMSDYSVPMKFNPTPAPTKDFPISPFDDHSPYDKAHNASSKSLGRASTRTTDSQLRPTNAPWASLTALFMGRPSTSSSRGPGSSVEDLTRHDASDKPRQLYATEKTRQGADNVELSVMTTNKINRSSSTTALSTPMPRTRDNSMEEHVYLADAHNVFGDGHALSPLGALTAGGPLRKSVSSTSERSASGSWSRATATANAKAALFYHSQSSHQAHPVPQSSHITQPQLYTQSHLQPDVYRPTTAGSTRSHRSYTFGPPGLSAHDDDNNVVGRAL